MRALLVLAILGPALARALRPREMIDPPMPVVITDSEPVSNVTYVAFPTARDWFTLNTTNYILWDWIEPHAPHLRVVLDRADGDVGMLKGPLTLHDKIPANMFGTKYNGTLPAAPGQGYRVRLHDFANASIVYATSELFAVKPAGADAAVPVPWGSPRPSALVSGANRAAVGTGAAAIGLLAALL